MLSAKQYPSDYDWPPVGPSHSIAVPIPPARLSFLGIAAGVRSLTLAEKRLAVALGTKWLLSGSVPASHPLRARVIDAQEALHDRASNRALKRAAWRDNPGANRGCGSFWCVFCPCCGLTLRRTCEECGVVYCDDCASENYGGNGVCSKACQDEVQAEKDNAREETRRLNGIARFERWGGASQ